MTTVEFTNRKIPSYYDYMYLDGYTPMEIYAAHKERIRELYTDVEEPAGGLEDTNLHITSEVKLKK